MTDIITCHYDSYYVRLMASEPGSYSYSTIFSEGESLVIGA